ncbi:amidohydrolase [Pseudonocardiaceae bacterium YIM PH 21723]|nr:amidohydrolase [Pseudonocardiaceae bacterium YIM PH 21723]
MRLIALEEAFWAPGLKTKGMFTETKPPWRPELLERVVTRLTDFTEHRLPEMDRLGVDVQVLSVGAPGIQAQPDADIAVSDARLANDYLAEVVGKHPDRFAGFAALPLQDPERAVTELRRAVEELGFVGALVNDHTNGHYLDEPQYAQVWAELERLDVPLYIHPSPPAEPWSVIAGHPVLDGPLFSWQATTGGHAMRLIYGRVFDRFPGARIILGHMGEFLPLQLSRIDNIHRMLDLPELPDRTPSEYFGRNIAITTTGVFSHAVLLAAIDAIGLDNVMFSVDYPYDDSEKGVEFIRTAPLSPADLAKVASGNAERILKLHR